MQLAGLYAPPPVSLFCHSPYLFYFYDVSAVLSFSPRVSAGGKYWHIPFFSINRPKLPIFGLNWTTTKTQRIKDVFILYLFQMTMFRYD